MLKWLLTGFLAGAIASAALFRVLHHRRVAQEAQQAAAAAALREETIATEREAAAKSAAALRRDRDRAIDESAKLKKRVFELESYAGGREGKRAGGREGEQEGGRKAAKTWAEIASQLGALAGKIRGLPMDSWPPEAEALKGDLRAAFEALAAELGMTPEEAMHTPGGLEALMLELLAQAVPPLSAEEEARLRELLAAQETDWERFREECADLSRLEQLRAFTELSLTSREQFLATLSPGHAELLKDYPLFTQDWQGSQTWIDGSRSKVTAAITDQWSASLGLNDAQKAALQPLVTEYIDRERALNEDIWARRRKGEDLSRQADYALRLGLMIETQKKISGTLSLAPDQEARLRDWQFTWGVNVTDEMGE